MTTTTHWSYMTNITHHLHLDPPPQDVQEECVNVYRLKNPVLIYQGFNTQTTPFDHLYQPYHLTTPSILQPKWGGYLTTLAILKTSWKHLDNSGHTGRPDSWPPQQEQLEWPGE